MKKYRIVSIILTLCLIISSVTMSSTSVVALETADSSTVQETVLTETADIFESSSQTIGSSAEGIEESEETTEPTTETFKAPDIVSADEAAEHGYIGRVKYAEKDLSTFVFQNEDGTNTMRVYSHPVKYVASSGEIRDISLDIKKNANGDFVTADHEIITTFAKNISGGITLAYDDIKVTMKPAASISRSNTATISEDSKKVSYVLNDKTSYEYALTYAGFKEDIVVNSYTGQTEYEFTLYTNGLSLYNEDGSYYLKDQNGDIAATIGDIIVFTADNRNNCMGSMTHQTVVENEEYRMTIHLDSGYLQDEKTKYPIRIDPTIEINYAKNGAGAIEDTTINSLQGSSGSSGSLYIGKRATYGLSRTLMRFPNLNLSNISSAQYITSASVELRDVLCEAESVTIYCYPFTGNTWTESTANWSNVNANSYGAQLSSQTVSYANGASKNPTHRYSFSILGAVRGWKSGTYSQSKGIIFKASSTVESGTTNIHKTFASYNRATNQPSFTMEYNPAITLPEGTRFVDVGSTLHLTATTNPSNATVTFTSLNTSIATVSSSGKTFTVTGVKAGTVTIRARITVDGTPYTDTCTVCVKIPDGVYYIQNKNSNLYLTTNGSMSNHIDLYQDDKHDASESEAIRIRQMWRINHLGEGKYSVRPLNALNMGLNTSIDSDAEIYNIGTSDLASSVPATAQYRIDWFSTGYVFWNSAIAPSLSMQVEQFSTTEGDCVVFEAFDSSQNCQWTLTGISSVPTGVYFYKPITPHIETSYMTYIASYESKSPSEMGLMAVPYYFDKYSVDKTVEWSSNNTSAVEVNSQTGTIIGINVGTATISASVNGMANTSIASYQVNTTRISNGTYYLKNKQTGYYADIQGPTMASGTTVHQWQFHGGNSQKWTFQRLNDGYYYIKSANSETAYYLGVINNSTGLNADVVLTSSMTAGTRWKIEPTSNGAYKIIPKTGEANGYTLATTTSDASNGYKLIQGAYVDNNSYRDEWILEGPKYSVINYYDSTFSPNTPKMNYITTAVGFANDVYQALCKTSFTSASPSTTAYSDADFDCPQGVNSPCLNQSVGGACGTDCSSHHKNTFRISQELNNGVEKNERLVLWTDRPENTYCKEVNDVHTTTKSIAVVWGSSRVIHVMTLQETQAPTLEAKMALTLIHEMTHTFGMPDQYNDPDHYDTSETICSMKEFSSSSAWLYYKEIENETKEPFCAACKAQIIPMIMSDFIS